MISRLLIYFKEMFPAHYFLAVFFQAFCLFMPLFKMTGEKFSWSTGILIGAISMVLFVLLIRVMDEFKDYEDDLINYPKRPLPSGRVYKKDLSKLMIFLTVTLTVINTYTSTLFITAVGVLIFSYLMLLWFFQEKAIRASLPLALLTHHPIVYIYNLYLVVAFTQDFELSSYSYLWIVVPIGFLSTNWELSRKIRPPEKEDGYTTYSQIWTPNGATIAAIITQWITLIGLLIYSQKFIGIQWVSILLVIAFLIPQGFYFYYIAKKKIPFGMLHLRSFAETQMFIAQIFLVTSYFL